MSREAASIALFDGASVLLIKRAFAPYPLYWSLPGGRLENGESHEVGLRRELDEELQLVLGDVRPVLVQNLPGFRLTVFAGWYPAGQTPRPNNEIADWCWHDVDEHLPTPHTDALFDIIAQARQMLG